MEIEPGEGGGKATSSADSGKSEAPVKEDTKPESTLSDKAEPKKESGDKMAEKSKPAPEPKKEEKKEVKKDEQKPVEEKAKGSRNETRVSTFFYPRRGFETDDSLVTSPRSKCPECV